MLKDFFSYYFVYETDLPASIKGFREFGPEHITWLVLLILTGFLACRWYRKLQPQTQRKVGHAIGITLVCMDAYKNIVLLALGHMDVEYLPLHLCGLSIFMELIYSYAETPFWGNVLYCLSAPGALSALLFPDWIRYPVWNFMDIHDFTLHGLLVIYPCMLLVAGKIKPDIRYFWEVMVFLIGLAVVMSGVNALLGTDFMFLRLPSVGSPLIAIRNLFGARWYLAGCFLLVSSIVFLIYLPPLLYSMLKRRKQKIEQEK